MVTECKMNMASVWLLATLAMAYVTCLVDGSPRKVLSAPNLLRLGAAENIFVECQDCRGGDIQVRINVKDHPAKTTTLATTSVTLNSANHFQSLGQIQVQPGGFSRDPSVKQYVYLQAQFPDRLLEKAVLVSFKSSYIFIQTDKTIYTPNSKVLYRMFAVTPRMEPVESHGEKEDAVIDIEIVTPDGIILPHERVPVTEGIHSGEYQLNEIVSPGLWKVVAKFQDNPQQSFSAGFEVKEYVLPSFDVRLTLVSPFFYVDSNEFTVNIKATYLFGEKVSGTAYVVFGVVLDGQKKSFPNSLQKVLIEKGVGVVQLKREHITATFPQVNQLVGKSLFVSVSVQTSGSEKVEAELRGIQIVTSPYTIHLKNTAKYFKPGLSLVVAVEVMNPDKTPAKGVPVVVEPGSVQSFTAANGIAKVTINTQSGLQRLTISAKTNDPQIPAGRQASASMSALPYVTKSKSYIHIGVEAAEVELGDNVKIRLILNRQANHDTDITYLIVSKGQLIKNGRYRIRGNVEIVQTVRITKDMLPSFRIVAYFHQSDKEVVSDSVWVDVKDTCMGKLKLESSEPAASYEPGERFGLKVSGDPEAIVGLVAVDKGVYALNNKHRLTQKKVWDIVEKSDTGCTAGGGKDSMNVFYDSGLLFESSTASGTPTRREWECPAPTRWKGSIITQRSTMDFTGSLIIQYEDNEDMKIRKDDENYWTLMESFEIVSRTSFPESWLWSDIRLPACPPQTPNCDSTSSMEDITLKHSLTSWQLIGISLSRTSGICVAEPLEVIVRKNFFIDLRLPYSAVRGEQLEIKAILHNYYSTGITVRVDLLEEKDVCSAAFKGAKFRQEVEVGPKTTRSVPFIIIPMKEGRFRIEVKAAVKVWGITDGVMKMLRVVPKGVLMKSPVVVSIDPTSRGVDGKQEETISSRMSKIHLVPNTPTSTQISVTGREHVAPLVENAISGTSVGHLIVQPTGCGEQSMAAMTLVVIATTYLDKTHQWETVGVQKRNEALRHIETGYNRQLSYRKQDGSFAVWANSASSTWLTAYVTKVFAMAHSLIALQANVICDAVKFLILRAQRPDGMFREVGSVYSGQMTGDVRGSDSDASMTAFCLIALQESRALCAASVSRLPDSIDKAVGYLERRLENLVNPYAVAMTSYALANEGKLNRDVLFKFCAALTHWPVPKGHIYTLEATAYALLALVKIKAFEDARHVVKWFNLQKKVGGGYGSTQATVMVYQAVAEYWSSAKEPDYDLNVDILLPGRTEPVLFHFNRTTQFVTRTLTLNDIYQDVKITATGTGEATVTMVSVYYALPQEKESDCQKFHLSVELIPVDMDEKVYKLRIEVLYKDEERDATMSILDIGLPTGFTVNTDDLDALAKGRARTIAKYETNTVLSERGSLIIYLDKVSHTRPEEITFRIHQTLRVGVLQPAAVSVYEYYEQTQCVKFYLPQRTAGQLRTICTNDSCTCAEENCSLQQKGKISNDLRTAKACESTPTSKMVYVYKVRLEEFKEVLSADMYTMRVLEVIKRGAPDKSPQGELRTFLGDPRCRKTLDLVEGKMYLIMVESKDIQVEDDFQLYQYVLGERTWIEYWPTDEECQTEEHRPTCLALEAMVPAFRCWW